MLPSPLQTVPFDDPAGLDGLVGDARVVAIGENNHHIAEFGALRERIVRHLVGERGFTVVAMESGFPESLLVDAWIGGGDGDADGGVDTLAADGFTFRFGDAPEVQEMLRRLRSVGGIRFAGLDVPGSGGTPVPGLEHVRGWLARHHPDATELVDAAVAATGGYAAANNGSAAARYAALDEAPRDAATTALARLLLRLDAFPVAADRREQRLARHSALGALRIDEQLRELVRLGEPDAPPLTVSSRDVFQAETVRLLRELHGSAARIVLLQHNGHLQRTPLEILPGVAMRTAGGYLAAELGEGYRAIALTAVGGTTTAPQLDDTARHGVGVTTHPLGPPEPGSLEHTLAARGPVLVDLRPARGTPWPTRMRHATTYVPVDVPQAFDGVVCLPEMHPSALQEGLTRAWGP